MRDCEDGAVPELAPDGGLHQVVCLQVHGGSCLVQDQDLVKSRNSVLNQLYFRPDLSFPEQRPGEAHQLPLTHGEVGAALENLVIKSRL